MSAPVDEADLPSHLRASVAGVAGGAMSEEGLAYQRYRAATQRMTVADEERKRAEAEWREALAALNRVIAPVG